MTFVNHNNLATLYNVVDSDLLWLNCIVLPIENILFNSTAEEEEEEKETAFFGFRCAEQSVCV